MPCVKQPVVTQGRRECLLPCYRNGNNYQSTKVRRIHFAMNGHSAQRPEFDIDSDDDIRNSLESIETVETIDSRDSRDSCDSRDSRDSHDSHDSRN